MCGIAGIVNFDNKLVNRNDIRVMMKKMKHRGPDDQGMFLDGNIGLGFVRLSILDLSSAGHQPMFSNDNRFVIVFNGEIYNYIEIRNELKNEFQFKTGTDTEVILAAYQKWGKDCLNKFNGMFAFVIYDTHSKEIFGARDRYGIKPFYYYIDKKRFIFASEIKAILPLLNEFNINNKAMFDYLVYNRTDYSNETFFNTIKKLEHGSLLSIRQNKISFSRWYKLIDKIDSKNISPVEYRELFKNSLKIRLRADVPVGVCLSGGIDSSAIVTSLTNDFHLKGIHTFSAVYEHNEPSNESKFINQFRSVLENMHFIHPTAETFFQDFEDFIVAQSEPMPDVGVYAQYKVMQLAQNFVKVTLDGQGADELLGGYHYFFGIYYLELVKKIKIIKFLYEIANYYYKHRSFEIYKYLLYYLSPRNIKKKIARKLYPSISEEFYHSQKGDSEIIEYLYSSKSLRNSLIQHIEYKLEHLLRWEDLNAMHFSIEARVPFLDHRLVESTLSLPSDKIIRGGTTKYILRESLKDILPKIIFERNDKKGFDNPRDKWFRTDSFKRLIIEIINSNEFKNLGYFAPKIAERRYKMHLQGEIDISREIWKWINIFYWQRHFFNYSQKLNK